MSAVCIPGERSAKELVGGLYEAEFKNQVRRRREPHPNGLLSEFSLD
jgi:hypothetical protein